MAATFSLDAGAARRRTVRAGAGKSRFQIAWPGSSGRAGCSTRETSRPRLQPAAPGPAHSPGAAAAGPPWCARRAARARRRPGRRMSRAQIGRLAHLLETGLVVGVTLPSIDVGVAADVLRSGVDRDVDAMLEGHEEDRVSPRYCPSARRRRVHAPLRRSPECPASRRCAIRGFDIDHPRVVADQLGHPGLDRRVVEGDLDPQRFSSVPPRRRAGP